MKITDKINNWIEKKQLENLVKTEAKYLRDNTTTEEKNNLKYVYLQPNITTRCVYGQMTGHCFSSRAVHLIRNGCLRVFKHKHDGLHNVTLSNSPKNNIRGDYWSPIEVFIYRNQFNQNNKTLIDYIKGETNKLKFI